MNWQRWSIPICGAIAGFSIAGACTLLPCRGESNFISPAPPAVPLDPFVPVQPRPMSPPVPLSRVATLNSQQLDQQFRAYLHYLSEVGTPDILIVGSSRALQGVDPLVLRQELVKRGYAQIKIYNFGINGATAQVVDLLLTRLLTPSQLPRLILWADGARAFNSGRLDQTYRNILASPGYRQIQAGRYPMLSATAIAEKICDPPTTPKAQAPSTAAASPRLSPPPPAPDSCPSPLSWVTQADAVIPAAAIPILQRALGFQPLATRFDPTRYFQRYPRVSGAYDGDYRQFDLAGSQTRALKNILAFTQGRNIPVLFVNLPMTRIYLDWARSDYEGQFRAYMRSYARANKLKFYDLGQRWLTRHDYFMDPSHLNREGGAAVATQLASILAVEVLNSTEIY
jgi:hypothetical protein